MDDELFKPVIGLLGVCLLVCQALHTPDPRSRPPRPIIAEIIDEKIAASKDAAEVKRLRELKNAVWPGSAPEQEP